MSKIAKRKIGIFLGRLQPQHTGHEMLIEKIFKENDEVVLCVGSAQKIKESDPAFKRNPLSVKKRIKRLRLFLDNKNFVKPYRIVIANDIEPEEAWPAYLRSCCQLTNQTQNIIYFGDPISSDYREGLEKEGFRIKHIKRKQFFYKSRKNTLHKISSATEIRMLENNI